MTRRRLQASSSMTRKPALCLVMVYSLPGLPSPTMSRFLLRGNLAGGCFFLGTAATPAAVGAPVFLPNGVPDAVLVLGLGDAGDDGDGGVVGIESAVATSPPALLPSLSAALDARLRLRELWGVGKKIKMYERLTYVCLIHILSSQRVAGKGASFSASKSALLLFSRMRLSAALTTLNLPRPSLCGFKRT